MAKLLETWSPKLSGKGFTPPAPATPALTPSPQLGWSHFSPSGQLRWNVLSKSGFGHEHCPVLHTAHPLDPSICPTVLSHFTHWETEALKRLTQDHAAGTCLWETQAAQGMSLSLLSRLPSFSWFPGKVMPGVGRGSHSRSQLWETSWIVSSHCCGNVPKTPSLAPGGGLTSGSPAGPWFAQGHTKFLEELSLTECQEHSHLLHKCLLHLTLFSCAATCGIFILRPGIEPAPPASKVQSLNHWASREVPALNILDRMQRASTPTPSPSPPRRQINRIFLLQPSP